MNSTNIRQITSGAHTHNEDLVGIYRSAGFTDIVVMDGGSSVAARNFIDDELGDVAWFVRNFAVLLEQANDRGRSQAESISLAINHMRAVFRERTVAVSVPIYAYPIAAMTWIRIVEAEVATTLKIYCLGDCKTLLHRRDDSVVDLDPYVNPQEAILREEIIKLSEQGFSDGAARKERLMPMLRARREFLNTSDSPTVLCLAPNGPFHAREHTVEIAPGDMLLAMTDGFYRLVDTYHLHTDEELAGLCRRGDLESLMKELRDFEAARLGSGSLSVKSSDDASAVTWMAAPR